jgi:hypothetical protein
LVLPLPVCFYIWLKQFEMILSMKQKPSLCQTQGRFFYGRLVVLWGVV